MKRILPPVFLILCSLLIAASHFFLPLMQLVKSPYTWLGYPLLVSGLLMATSIVRKFKEVGTNIHTFKEPDKFVESGLFSHTRNPIYLGFSIAVLGVAFLGGHATAFLIAIFHFLVLDRYYIPFEEARMSEQFGDEYQQYKDRVRRWA